MSRILQITKVFLTALLVLVVVSLAVVQIPFIQKKIVDIVISSVNNDQIKVKYDTIEMFLFHELHTKHLSVSDTEGNIILYAEELSIDLNPLRILFGREISLSGLLINRANISAIKTGGVWNFQVFKKTGQSSWLLNVFSIAIRNVSVQGCNIFICDNDTHTSRIVKNISGGINSVNINYYKFGVDVSDISFDIGRFRCNRCLAKVFVIGNDLLINKLELISNCINLDCDGRLCNVNNFLGVFDKNSRLNVNALELSPNLNLLNIHESIFLSGRLYVKQGMLCSDGIKARCSDCDLTTSFIAKIINDRSKINYEVNTSGSFDLMQVIPARYGQHIKKLNLKNISCKLVGNLKECNVVVTCLANNGKIDYKCDVEFDDSYKIKKLNGVLFTSDVGIDLNPIRLSNVDSLTNVTLDSGVFSLSTKCTQLGVNDISISNVELTVTYTGGSLKWSLRMNDKSIACNLTAIMQTRENEWGVRLSGNFDINKDEHANFFSTNVVSNAKFTDHNGEFKLRLFGLDAQYGLLKLQENDLDVCGTIKDGLLNGKLRSKFLDFDIVKCHMYSIKEDFDMLLNRITAYINGNQLKKVNIMNNDFLCLMKVKNKDLLYEISRGLITSDELEVSYGTSCNGTSTVNKFSLLVPHAISIRDVKMQDIVFRVGACFSNIPCDNVGTLDVFCGFEDVSFKKKIMSKLQFKMCKQFLSTLFTTHCDDECVTSVSLGGVFKNGTFYMNLADTNNVILINGNRMNVDGIVLWNRKLLKCENVIFGFPGCEQCIKISGHYTPRTDSVLKVLVNEFDFSISYHNLSGRFCSVIEINGSNNLHSEISLRDFVFDGMRFGSMDLKNDFLYKNRLCSFNYRIFDDDGIANLCGSFSPIALKFQNTSLRFCNFGIARFGVFSKCVFTEFIGYLDGTLYVEGTIHKPKFRGKVSLLRSKMEVAVLKIPLNIDRVVITGDNNNFYFSDCRCGRNDSTAIINGRISINGIKVPIVYINGVFSNYVLMNVDEKTKTVYGNIIADGSFILHGKLNELEIASKCLLKKNSKICINVLSESFDHDFIHIEDNLHDIPNVSFRMPIKLKLDISITPGLCTNICFSNGNMMQFSGNGDIGVECDVLHGSNLKLVGKYDIVEGIFTFNLYSLISRSFSIMSGSYIKCNGDLLKNTDICLYAKKKGSFETDDKSNIMLIGKISDIRVAKYVDSIFAANNTDNNTDDYKEFLENLFSKERNSDPVIANFYDKLDDFVSDRVGGLVKSVDNSILFKTKFSRLLKHDYLPYDVGYGFLNKKILFLLSGVMNDIDYTHHTTRFNIKYLLNNRGNTYVNFSYSLAYGDIKTKYNDSNWELGTVFSKNFK